jgi:DNA methylase/ParB-like nuclease domain
MQLKSKHREALNRKAKSVETLVTTKLNDLRRQSEPNDGCLLANTVGFRDLAIDYRPTNSLTPSPGNPRVHTPKQIRQLADCVSQFGFIIAILTDSAGRIIAGHGRWLAAKLLGYERVPTVCVDHLTDPQKRAFMIADNKLNENSSWDRELLATEFRVLSELDFDLTLTGFETAEIDILLDEGKAPVPDEADVIPALEAPVSRLGDLWLLLKHRLVCGDATQSDTVSKLMAGTKAQASFNDPPFNVRVDGHVCGSGSIKHAEFLMASGEMSSEEYINFLSTFFKLLVANSADGSIHFCCIDWRHLFELLSAGREVFHELKNICIWNKTNGGQGSFYRSKYECVAVFKNGDAPHINNIDLGRLGWYRTNVWDYAGVNSFREGRLEDLLAHPTVKPAALVADAIRDVSRRNGIVLDLFSGSGTTLIAAQQTGRIAYAMELEPKFVDVAIKRFEKVTGEKAIHAETGLTFEETKRTRAEEASTTGKAEPKREG